VRITIGGTEAWTIPQAREKARELQRLIDEGRDPRDLKRQALADQAKSTAEGATVQTAWDAYVAERKPRWGDRHYEDHLSLTRAGGEVAKRGTRGRGKTIAGPLAPLLGLSLRQLDAATLEGWAAKEAPTRPSQARLALRCFRAFLNWAEEHEEFKHACPSGKVVSRKTRESLGRDSVKQDALLREQLPAWFSAVRTTTNPAQAAYLQTVLLTGARPGEVLDLRWEDLDDQWKSLTIRDKVEGTRKIPLTPYVSQLLHALPRTRDKAGRPSPWVFSSSTSADGQLTIPRNAHVEACAVAGIEGLTLHGLRRSFKSLTEWLEIPAGVVAQIMGHKPSATAEKHYTVRPLDLLRVHHQRIEKWMLEQAHLALPKLRNGDLIDQAIDGPEHYNPTARTSNLNTPL
jgi:integrase